MLLRPFSSSFRPAALRHSSKSSRRHSSASRGGGSDHHHLLSSISICATCKNSPSAATLDLLILLLALFCSSFLVASSLAHVFRFLAFLLPASSFRHAPYPYLAALLLPLFFAASLVVALLSCSRPLFFSWFGRRCCGRPRCRGLKKALEFDLQLQTEECIRSPDPTQTAAWKEIDDLPWKGGQQGNNPDYECLRVELRRMAPSNGRAVLLFRARCGCPLAKLEAWGPKRSRRNKKS